MFKGPITLERKIKFTVISFSLLKEREERKKKGKGKIIKKGRNEILGRPSYQLPF